MPGPAVCIAEVPENINYATVNFLDECENMKFMAKVLYKGTMPRKISSRYNHVILTWFACKDDSVYGIKTAVSVGDMTVNC